MDDLERTVNELRALRTALEAMVEALEKLKRAAADDPAGAQRLGLDWLSRGGDKPH